MACPVCLRHRPAARQRRWLAPRADPRQRQFVWPGRKADSLGNRGRMGAGDVQWMTAGSGILHQEMPKGDPQGRMHGFQLWSNLPSSLKMTKPRYQDISSGDIPEVTDDDGTRVRVIIGNFWGKAGPVEGVAADPRYLDVLVPPGQTRRLAVDRGGQCRYAGVALSEDSLEDAVHDCARR